MSYTIHDKRNKECGFPGVVAWQVNRSDAIAALCNARDMNTYTATAMLDKADGIIADWPNAQGDYDLIIGRNK